jgi:hypothetical protein
MKTAILRILVLAMFAAVSAERLLAQQIDPKGVAKLVTEGRIKFSPKSKITIWLDENQNYSISPVVADNETHTYRTQSEFAVLLAGPQGPPRPPPPKPPPPINHTGPRPPAPIPPGPHNSRPPKPPPTLPKPPPTLPKPPPKPKTELGEQGVAADLLYQLAEQGVIVGRLETEGISQKNWKLAKGAYTIVLTLLEDKPVATLVNSNGEFVVTFDNIFFVNAQ